MTRWEHLVRGLPNGPPEAIEAWLNVHGEAGWILVTVNWTDRLAVFTRSKGRWTPNVPRFYDEPTVTAAE